MSRFLVTGAAIGLTTLAMLAIPGVARSAPLGDASTANTFAAPLGDAAAAVNPDGRVARAASHTNTLIVPGRSIGPVSLGMSRASVERAYPFPYTESTDTGFTALTFEHGKLFVQFAEVDKTLKAFHIATSDPGFRLSKGITVGSSLEALQAAYPVSCQGDPLPPHDVYGCKMEGPPGHLTNFIMSTPQEGPEHVVNINIAGKGEEPTSCPFGGVATTAFRGGVAHAALSGGCRLTGVEGKPTFVGGIVPAQCTVENPTVTVLVGSFALRLTATSFGPSEGGIRYGNDEVTLQRFGDYAGTLDYKAKCPDSSGKIVEKDASQEFVVHITDAPIRLFTLDRVRGSGPGDRAAGLVAYLVDDNKYSRRTDLSVTIDYGDDTQAIAVLGANTAERDDKVIYQVFAPAHLYSGKGPFAATLTAKSVGGSTSVIAFKLETRDGAFAGIAPSPIAPAKNAPPEPRTVNAGNETAKPNPNASLKANVGGNAGASTRNWFGALCGQLGGFGRSLCGESASEVADAARAVNDPPDQVRARVLPQLTTATDRPSTSGLGCGRASRARCAQGRAAFARFLRAQQGVTAATRALGDAVDRAAGARQLARRFRVFSVHAQLAQLGAMRAYAGRLAAALKARARAGRTVAARMREAKINVTLTRAKLQSGVKLLTAETLPAGLATAFIRVGLTPAEGVAILKRTARSARGFNLQAFVAMTPRTAALERFYHSITVREVAEIQQTLAAGLTIDASLHDSLSKALEQVYRSRGRARSRALARYIRSARKVPGTGGTLLRYAVAAL